MFSQIDSIAAPTNMEGYYKFRRLLHTLYDNDVRYGDLAGAILNYRDVDKDVESISLKIQEYKIYVEVREDIDVARKGTIANNISNIISNFIRSCLDQFNEEDKNLISTYINNQMYNNVDCYITLSNQIEIVL